MFVKFLNFNSIKVRLEQKFSDLSRKHVTNFNSIKVRLEHFDAIQNNVWNTISIP